jgi:hypothetical protein
MVLEAKGIGRLIPRLMVTLALLGCPRVGAAQGTWSVISVLPNPSKPGEAGAGQVLGPAALAADAAGNLYVAERPDSHLDVGLNRMHRRYAQGHWSVIATEADAVGQVREPTALGVDAAGNLYVADYGDDGQDNSGPRIQKRDAQGNWSVIAYGTGLDDWHVDMALAVDAADNLYVSGGHGSGCNIFQVCYRWWIKKRDALGNWSVIAAGSGVTSPELTRHPLSVDAAGNLYAAGGGIQKRDAQGNWSVIATQGAAAGQVNGPIALAADSAGNLYVADGELYTTMPPRIQKRDVQGNWSVIATAGYDLGQVSAPSGLAVDGSGNLYVADDQRVQRYTPHP